ncbi:MAG: sensor histidine kinase [Acidimicrobiales bacterium]
MSSDAASNPALVGLRRARAQHAATLRWLGLLVPVLLVLVLAPAFRAHPGPGAAGRGLVVSICLAGFLLGALGMRATLSRSLWIYMGCLLLLLASSVTLMAVQAKGPGIDGVFIAVLFFARKLPGKASIVLSVVAFVFLGGIAVIADRGGGASVILVLVFGGFYVMARLAMRLGEANEQAERLLVELEQSRASEAKAAAMAERQRLAREMHDVLAHSLSGLMLQLEGARMLAVENPDDPRLRQAIERAHHLGQLGLEEARRAIGMLRDDELPGPERLAELAAQFEEDRGVTCQVSVSGEARPLDPEARLALFRVAQEALTNVAKHAHPERVELHLAYEPSATRLSVEDFTTTNGSSPAPTNDGGYGLTGMRERAELLGGTLTADKTRNGFRVELEVPA